MAWQKMSLTEERQKFHIKNTKNVKIVLYQVSQGNRIFRNKGQGQQCPMFRQVNMRLIFKKSLLELMPFWSQIILRQDDICEKLEDSVLGGRME